MVALCGNALSFPSSDEKRFSVEMHIPVDAVSPLLYFGRFWNLTLFLCVIVVHSSVFELLQDSSVVVRFTSHVAAEALQVIHFVKCFYNHLG